VNSPRILYGQVREDPEADREALQISPADRLLVVTSGGCTALTLLADGPQELAAVDLNPAQNHLLELKLAAVRELPLPECRVLMGARKGRNRRALYQKVASSLSPEARAFWDGRQGLVDRGLLYAGTTEAMVRWMRPLLFGLVHRTGIIRDLFRRKSLARQAEFYRETWSNLRWRALLGVAFNPLTFRLAYGKGFFARANARDFSRDWRWKVERAFAEVPAANNYFLSQTFWGRALPGEQGIPPYLRAGIFERVRENAARLRWQTADVVTHLSSAQPGSITKAALSNAFEWLPARRVEAAFAALARALAPGGRAVLRHLLGVTPVPPGLPLREATALSDDLTRRERAFLYARVSVYEKI
jgi:S-adenosylmethionine-diacylglycerol 3-amino-3-carboxypropyl transferase